MLGPVVGELLRDWRKTRHLSQLALAANAEVSARHLCFVETGRANPSRDMVLRLARVLDVPLRERNTLLLAAGFAPAYGESKMDAPALEVVRKALDAILRQQEPFPAIVMNRQWDIVRANEAAARFFRFLLEERAPRRRPTCFVECSTPRQHAPSSPTGRTSLKRSCSVPVVKRSVARRMKA